VSSAYLNVYKILRTWLKFMQYIVINYIDIVERLSEEQKEKDKKIELEAADGPASPSRTKKAEELRAIRISNNKLPRIDIIFCLSSILNFESIMWIDISFNSLTKISKALAETCPNLSTLYMQANQIAKISDLKVLSSLTKLKSLTMFGNPVEESKHYRNMIFYQCPSLHQLDFAPITSSQRKKVSDRTCFLYLGINKYRILIEYVLD